MHRRVVRRGMRDGGSFDGMRLRVTRWRYLEDSVAQALGKEILWSFESPPTCHGAGATIFLTHQFCAETDVSNASGGQLSSVGVHDLSGLYSSMSLKVLRVSGPKSFW